VRSTPHTPKSGHYHGKSWKPNLMVQCKYRWALPCPQWRYLLWLSLENNFMFSEPASLVITMPHYGSAYLIAILPPPISGLLV